MQLLEVLDEPFAVPDFAYPLGEELGQVHLDPVDGGVGDGGFSRFVYLLLGDVIILQ